jgi:drug/metabolite transporter (DMT)-like permease
MPHSLLYALATVALWSVGATLAKTISGSEPLLVILLSFSFAALVYAVQIWVQQGRKGLFMSIKAIPWRWWVIGPFGYFFYWLGFLNSFRSFAAYSGTASETTVLNYTWPIFTLIFSALLLDRNRRTDRLALMVEYAAIGLAFGGVYLLATNGRMMQVGNVPGILWGLLAGASYGLFSAYSRTVEARAQSAFLLVSVLASLPLTGGLLLVQQLQPEAIPLQLSARMVGLAALSGLLIDGLGYLLWTRALITSVEEGVPLGRIAAVVYVLPLLSLGVVGLWFGETRLFDADVALATLLVLSGAVVSQHSGRIAGWISRRT